MNSSDRPLARAAKIPLVLAAAGIIAVFYVFVVIAIFLLLVLFLIEVVVLLALLRFGLASLMSRVIHGHMAPLPVLFRSLWIGKSADYHLAIKEADAPRLYAILTRLCERAGITVPAAVFLEMNANAWVRLKGYRRGKGTTILGVGYDLLAGLSEPEVEGVLAHEVMHAKLMQRGFSTLIKGGFNRAVKLAGGLSEEMETSRRLKQPATTTQLLLQITDWQARQVARLVAACSRQNEFDADMGAAQLCGAGAIRSALIKIETASFNAARLPWRERVAQIQKGGSFSGWLTRELSANAVGLHSAMEDRPFNKYSTHPSLKDRLAALPPGELEETGARPGIELLAHPDRAAENLIEEVQRVAALEEAKDTKMLHRWTRNVRKHSALSDVQSVSILAGILGVVIGLIIWGTVGLSAGVIVFVLGMIAVGVLGARFGGHRERVALPVPAFATLMTAWKAGATFKEEAAKALEAELEALAASEQKARKQARLLVTHAYAALERCEYLRAHAAALLCLKKDKRSSEGMLALAVAAAALGIHQQVTWALQTLQKTRRATGFSREWGLGWSLCLCGDWSHAEAFLHQALKSKPEHATLVLLSAICQSRRGKEHSAIQSARTGCSLSPDDREGAKLLIDLLLNTGHLREANERLTQLGARCNEDKDLMFCMLRFKVLSRELADAHHWATLIRQTSSEAQLLVRLGGIYEAARHDDIAGGYYTEAAAADYYPEALLGLGRIAARGQRKEFARERVLAALDVNRKAGVGSVGTPEIFGNALGQLLELQEPTLNCRAWTARMGKAGVPALVAEKAVKVFAASEAEARGWVDTLLQAMQPGLPVSAVAVTNWRLAPKPDQPDGPVHPGIQQIAG